MPQLTRRPAGRATTALARCLLVIDLAVGLLPPLHWLSGTGNASMSVGYFLLAGAIITLSLPALMRLDQVAGDTP